MSKTQATAKASQLEAAEKAHGEALKRLEVAKSEADTITQDIAEKQGKTEGLSLAERKKAHGEIAALNSLLEEHRGKVEAAQVVLEAASASLERESQLNRISNLARQSKETFERLAHLTEELESAVSSPLSALRGAALELRQQRKAYLETVTNLVPDGHLGFLMYADVDEAHAKLEALLGELGKRGADLSILRTEFFEPHRLRYWHDLQQPSLTLPRGKTDWVNMALTMKEEQRG